MSADLVEAQRRIKALQLENDILQLENKKHAADNEKLRAFLKRYRYRSAIKTEQTAIDALLKIKTQ